MPKQQLIPEPSLRKAIRTVLNGPILSDDLLGVTTNISETMESTSQETDPTQNPSEKKRKINAAIDHIERVDLVYQGLNKLSSPLGALFYQHYGPSTLEQKRKAPTACKKFFEQV
jgi:hypothetical protein